MLVEELEVNQVALTPALQSEDLAHICDAWQPKDKRLE